LKIYRLVEINQSARLGHSVQLNEFDPILSSNKNFLIEMRKIQMISP